MALAYSNITLTNVNDAIQYYYHVVYCDDTSSGSGYSTTGGNKNYIGTYTDTTPESATTWSGLSGKNVSWVYAKGAKGDTGLGSWTPVFVNAKREGDTFISQGGVASAWNQMFKSQETYKTMKVSWNFITTGAKAFTAKIQTQNETPYQTSGVICVYHKDDSNKTTEVYIKGTKKYTDTTTRTVNDVWSISYDGTTARAYKNGSEVYSENAVVTSDLYFDTWCWNSTDGNAKVKNVTITEIGAKGDKGDSPYTCSVSNESFTIPTYTDLRPISQEEYPITFRAYHGNTELIATNPSSAVTSGHFKITTPENPTGINITRGADYGTLVFSVQTASAIEYESSVDVTVTYENGSTETKTISISAALMGEPAKVFNITASLTSWEINKRGSKSPDDVELNLNVQGYDDVALNIQWENSAGTLEVGGDKRSATLSDLEDVTSPIEIKAFDANSSLSSSVTLFPIDKTEYDKNYGVIASAEYIPEETDDDKPLKGDYFIAGWQDSSKYDKGVTYMYDGADWNEMSVDGDNAQKLLSSLQKLKEYVDKNDSSLEEYSSSNTITWLKNLVADKGIFNYLFGQKIEVGTDGYIQTVGFDPEADEKGFRISGDGTAVFTQATIKGNSTLEGEVNNPVFKTTSNTGESKQYSTSNGSENDASAASAIVAEAVLGSKVKECVIKTLNTLKNNGIINNNSVQTGAYVELLSGTICGRTFSAGTTVGYNDKPISNRSAGDRSYLDAHVEDTFSSSITRKKVVATVVVYQKYVDYEYHTVNYYWRLLDTYPETSTARPTEGTYGYKSNLTSADYGSTYYEISGVSQTSAGRWSYIYTEYICDREDGTETGTSWGSYSMSVYNGTTGKRTYFTSTNITLNAGERIDVTLGAVGDVSGTEYGGRVYVTFDERNQGYKEGFVFTKDGVETYANDLPGGNIETVSQNLSFKNHSTNDLSFIIGSAGEWKYPPAVTGVKKLVRFNWTNNEKKPSGTGSNANILSSSCTVKDRNGAVISIPTNLTSISFTESPASITFNGAVTLSNSEYYSYYNINVKHGTKTKGINSYNLLILREDGEDPNKVTHKIGENSTNGKWDEIWAKAVYGAVFN